MKKKYMTPESEAISLHMESAILADSRNIGIGDGSIEDKTEIRSSRHGWSSADWTAADGEE